MNIKRLIEIDSYRGSRPVSYTHLVGYRAAKQGKQLVLNIGYSHQVLIDETDGITFEVPDTNTVIVNGPDKQKVGQIASEIRGKRPPEPYLGKGIKYSDEHIRRKAGKAGK